MPALAWVMLAVGMLAGGLVGFVVARLVGASGAAGDMAAHLAEAAAEAQATADKAVVDAKLVEREKLAATAGDKELLDALEEDFARPHLPDGHPLRRPAGGK